MFPTDARNTSLPDVVDLYMLYPVAPLSAVHESVIGYAVVPSVADTSVDAVLSPSDVVAVIL